MCATGTCQTHRYGQVRGPPPCVVMQPIPSVVGLSPRNRATEPHPLHPLLCSGRDRGWGHGMSRWDLRCGWIGDGQNRPCVAFLAAPRSRYRNSRGQKRGLSCVTHDFTTTQLKRIQTQKVTAYVFDMAKQYYRCPCCHEECWVYTGWWTFGIGFKAS